MPRSTSAIFIGGAVTGAAIVLSLGFVVHYVRRDVNAPASPWNHPPMVPTRRSSKVDRTPTTVVEGRPTKDISTGPRPQALPPGMGGLADWFLQRSDDSDRTAIGDQAARLVEPIWISYLVSRKANREAEYVDAWQQLFERGIVINADNYAYAHENNPDPPNHVKKTAVIDAWNALTAASDNPRSMAGSNLANNSMRLPPAKIVNELPPGMASQTHLPVSTAALSAWLKPSAADHQSPMTKINERATLLVGYLAYPYGRDQDGGVRQRLQQFGIIVDPNHGAHFDPALADPARIDSAKAQAFVEAWNARAPKPRPIVPERP